jgi:hypothetical protein
MAEVIIIAILASVTLACTLVPPMGTDCFQNAPPDRITIDGVTMATLFILCFASCVCAIIYGLKRSAYGKGI